MPEPGTQMQPSVWPRSAPVVLLVAVCSLLAGVLPAGAAAGSVSPSFGSTRGGTGVPNGPVSCDALVSGATLTELVDQYYPNGSLLPSQSQAELAVTSTWSDLCGSATFQQALSSAGGGWFAYISRMQDKTWTASGELVGSLFVDFELTWNASCPAGQTAYPSGFGCQFDEVWQANLSSRAVTGPAITITSLRFVPCDTPDANETAVGSVEGFFPAPGTAPNESVAVQEVQTIWAAICTSPAYYAVAASLDVPQVLSFSTWRATTGPNATLSTSGHLYFQWSLFTGDGPCPSGNGLTCSFSEVWTADLTLDTFSGPSNSSSSGLHGIPPGPQISGNDPGADWLPTALGYGAFGGVVVVAVLVGVVDRRRR